MLAVAPDELFESLSAVRLCSPQAQQEMRLSLSRLGQLTPVQAYRVGARLELFDGLKRLRAARELSWPRLRVEVHTLDSAGAKVRLLCCNAGTGLAELEDGSRAVIVAYGTSQKTTSLLAGEFLISASDGEAYEAAGLSYATKFDLARLATLPCTEEWFRVPTVPSFGQTPKLGILHPSLMRRAQAAFETAAGPAGKR